MKPISIVAVAVIGCGLVGAGAWEFFSNSPSSSNSPTPTVEEVTPPQKAPQEVIRTPAWYEEHQDVLRTDNERCQALGTKLPEQLCANVAIADHNVSSDNLLKALDQASSPGAK